VGSFYLDGFAPYGKFKLQTSVGLVLGWIFFNSKVQNQRIVSFGYFHNHKTGGFNERTAMNLDFVGKKIE
jgi:hypothetical protein